MRFSKAPVTPRLDDFCAAVDKIAVVFIEHNVRHALAVGDRFSELNRGQRLDNIQRGQINPE